MRYILSKSNIYNRNCGTFSNFFSLPSPNAKPNSRQLCKTKMKMKMKNYSILLFEQIFGFEFATNEMKMKSKMRWGETRNNAKQSYDCRSEIARCYYFGRLLVARKLKKWSLFWRFYAIHYIMLQHSTAQQSQNIDTLPIYFEIATPIYVEIESNSRQSFVEQLKCDCA